MAKRGRPRRDLTVHERAVLAELADGGWRTSGDFAPGLRRWIVRTVFPLLLDRGLVEREALDVPSWYATHRWRWRITAAGRAELAR